MGEVPWDSSSPTPNSSTDKPRGRGLESALVHSLSFSPSFYLLAAQPLSDRSTLLTKFTRLCVFCLFIACSELARLCCVCTDSFDGSVSILAKISHFRSLLLFQRLRSPSLTHSLSLLLSFLLQKIIKIYWTKQCIGACLQQTDILTWWVVFYAGTIIHYS